MSIFANMIHDFSSVFINVYKSRRLPLYDTSYEALIFNVDISVTPNFLDYSPNELNSMPPVTINNLFINFIQDKYPFSEGYVFVIPVYWIQSSANLPSNVSSFTAEGRAILKATF